MKKIFALFITCSMLLSCFAGCASVTTSVKDDGTKDSGNHSSAASGEHDSSNGNNESTSGTLPSAPSTEGGDSSPSVKPSLKPDGSESESKGGFESGSSENPPPSETPSPSSPSEDDDTPNTTLTLEELKVLWEQLKDNQTSEEPIDPEEQSKIEEQIKDAIEANKDPISDKEVYNILLIGYEEKYEDGAKNSDTMMLLSINFKAKTITTTSFMRDTYVQIPGVGNNRLNVAYAVKGYPLLKATIQNNFGISIDNYVALSFSAFIEFYDAIGGMDVNITKAELDHMNKNIPIYYKAYAPKGYPANLEPLKAGINHLDGVQLLVYARNRTSGGDADFGRTARQRALIGDTVKKMTTLSVTELYNLMELMLPKVTTDIPADDCSSLLMKMITRNAFSYKQQSFRIPADGTWKEKTVRIAGTNQQVLAIDFAENTKRFKKLVYGID